MSKEKLLSKVARFEVTSMIGEDKRLMNYLLEELRKDSREMGNELIQTFYEESRFGKSVLLNADSYTQLSRQGKINYELKKKYTKFNTSGVETITQKVMKEWRTNQKKFYKGESRIISYNQANSPLFIRNTQIKLMKNDEQYIIKVRLLSSDYAKELEQGFELEVGDKKKKILYQKKREGQWLDFEVIVKGGYLTSIFNHAMNNEYKIGTSLFLYNKHKKKWFFNLTYSFVTEKVEIDKNNVMGIDLGYTNPTALAISNDDRYYKFVGDGEAIKKFQEQIKERISRLQRSRKWAGDGSVGHGTKTRIKPLRLLGPIISNYKDTENHKYSKSIVNEAVSLGVGVIQMENLNGIGKKRKALRDWTYNDLQQKIKYKAEEKGIEVIIINPKFTSQRCHKCGYINKENRNNQKFDCTTCGYICNADINAARNIAMRNIEKIIEEQLKIQLQKAI